MTTVRSPGFVGRDGRSGLLSPVDVAVKGDVNELIAHRVVVRRRDADVHRRCAYLEGNVRQYVGRRDLGAKRRRGNPEDWDDPAARRSARRDAGLMLLGCRGSIATQFRWSGPRDGGRICSGSSSFIAPSWRAEGHAERREDPAAVVDDP